MSPLTFSMLLFLIFYCMPFKSVLHCTTSTQVESGEDIGSNPQNPQRKIIYCYSAILKGGNQKQKN